MHSSGCSRWLSGLRWLLPLCFWVTCHAGEGSVKICGVVRLDGKAVEGAQVTLLDSKEARGRYESRMAVARSNLVVMAEITANLKTRREELERNRTLKVYRGMFPEVGPAEREELKKQIAGLNEELDSVNAEEARIRAQAEAQMDVGAFFQPAWTNVLATGRTSADGRFSLCTHAACDCWLALPLGPDRAGKTARGWLIPLKGASPGVVLSETNSIGVRP